MSIVITFTIVISYYYTLLHHISISSNQNSACMPCQKRKTQRKKSQKNWYLEACRNLLLPCLAPVCSLNESLSSSILFAWITMFTVEELQAQQSIECWHPYTCDYFWERNKNHSQNSHKKKLKSFISQTISVKSIRFRIFLFKKLYNTNPGTALAWVRWVRSNPSILRRGFSNPSIFWEKVEEYELELIEVDLILA